MAAELGATTQGLLDDLPPYEADDTAIRTLIDAVGRELARLDDFITYVRDHIPPQSADDTYGLLQMWEAFYGLPISPDGITVGDRQGRVLAALKRRQAGGGEAFAQLVTLALGTSSWMEAENTPGRYQVKITIPTGTTSLSADQMRELLPKLAPAHIQFVLDFGTGFEIGISEIGDPL